MVCERNIWKEIRRMRKRLDLKNEFFSDVKMLDENSTLTCVVAHRVFDYRRAWTGFEETANEFILTIELPGVEKEDIKLNLTESDIEVVAEKKKEIEKKDKGEYKFSKDYIGFARSVTLPEDVDKENIDALYKNGVLTVKISKKNNLIKKIEVKIK